MTVESTAPADALPVPRCGKMREEKMKWLNKIVFCVALLEWGGNAVGTLASLWATVVLLGGFCSLLSPKDFWFSTVMIFVEATRVFIRNDALVSQWLFGSTRAIRWQDFSLRPMAESLLRSRNLIALIIGMSIGSIPAFRPEIITSIIKVALLVIISQILPRSLVPTSACSAVFSSHSKPAQISTNQYQHLFPVQSSPAEYLLIFLGIAAYCGGAYGFYKTIAALRPRVKAAKIIGLIIAWEVGTGSLSALVYAIRSNCVCLRKARGLIPTEVITALSLACFPFLQAILGSYYRYVSRSMAIVLLVLNIPIPEEEEEPLPNEIKKRHFFQIVDTIMPILFFWSVMFPLPGISLKLSFYMLFSAIAAVLIGNLQIPVVFLQVLLSMLRLCSLLGHHHYHDYYHPLPDGASPNLVPSIVVFFMLELCQGSSYIVATILGLISLTCRRWLVHDLGFTQEWGAKAVNLYYHQAYQERTEKGLFGSVEKEKCTPSLDSFAIGCLGCSSSDETQIVGLQVLKKLLESRGSMPEQELISKITCTSNKAVVPTLIDMLGYTSTVARHQEIRLLAAEIIEKLADCCPDNCTEIVQESTYIATNIIGLISYCTTDKTKNREKEVGLFSALKLVRMLAIKGGKTGARLRKELSENPLLLKSLKGILEDCQRRQPELLEVVMDIIAKLALDEAARQEIGSTQAIIGELMHAFLRPNKTNNDLSLARTAGEALANLTIMSTDNCWAILLADKEKEHNLIKNLVDMIEDDNYRGFAANLLHNLCANSRDKLIDIGAKVHLEPALPKVIQIILTKEGEQLEAALCVASQIGYVIPEYFVQMLESYYKSYSDAAGAAELVQKLVDTLKLNREPCLQYPRIRRVLVEVVISIVDLCPRYSIILREKGAKDALDMVKGTPSKLEKYRVLLDGGEGVVMESVPMRDLVDKAKRLIHQATPTLGT